MVPLAIYRRLKGAFKGDSRTEGYNSSSHTCFSDAWTAPGQFFGQVSQLCDEPGETSSRKRLRLGACAIFRRRSSMVAIALRVPALILWALCGFARPSAASEPSDIVPRPFSREHAVPSPAPVVCACRSSSSNLPVLRHRTRGRAVIALASSQRSPKLHLAMPLAFPCRSHTCHRCDCGSRENIRNVCRRHYGTQRTLAKVNRHRNHSIWESLKTGRHSSVAAADRAAPPFGREVTS